MCKSRQSAGPSALQPTNAYGLTTGIEDVGKSRCGPAVASTVGGRAAAGAMAPVTVARD